MIYITLLVLSLTLTYLIKNFAIKKSMVATVNERSSHTIPTPHGGGIAIAFTWLLGLLYLFYSNAIDTQLFYALMIGFIISVVSFFDDIYELSAKIRLIAQSFVAIFGLITLGGLQTIDFGFFVIENQVINNLFAFFMIMWFINLYNFLDGINGYAGSEAVFLSVAGFLLFADSHFLVLAVAVLGFLYWNWNKAKIFMGDVGSTLLGYNIAVFTLYYANQSSLNLWVWILLFSVFWYDATLTLLRRKLNGEKLSQAHKKHAYQRLTQAGWSHYKVTSYSIVLNSVLFVIVYTISNLMVAFFMALIVLYASMKFVDKKKAFQ